MSEGISRKSNLDAEDLFLIVKGPEAALTPKSCMVEVTLTSFNCLSPLFLMEANKYVSCPGATHSSTRRRDDTKSLLCFFAETSGSSGSGSVGVGAGFVVPLFVCVTEALSESKTWAIKV